MKAVYIADYGAIDQVVRLGELPNPTIGPDEVLIRVRAAGVNPIDWKIAEGQAKAFIPLVLPSILGNEVAGVVAQAGSQATSFKKGDEVYARLDPMKGGAFAEYVAVDAKLVALKPGTTDFSSAAGVPLAALTAWQVLFEHVKLEKAQKILVHAGSGGVGSFAIQLAKHVGAEVATTTGSDGVALAKALGADLVVDYTRQRFEDVLRDFDVVFDTVGGDTQQRSMAVLKRGGQLTSIVPLTVDQDSADKAGVRLQRVFMRPNGRQLAEIAQQIDTGSVKPIIDRHFSLDKAGEALLYSRSGRAKGKIVIQIG